VKHDDNHNWREKKSIPTEEKDDQEVKERLRERVEG